MRHTFTTMGTVASIELAEGHVALLPGIEVLFADVEARFSLYLPESELSRVAAGTLTLPGASDRLRDSYSRALQWRRRTAGAFTPHRPDGVVDLNGIAKAQAIESAGDFLEAAGCPDFTINVGGDILVGGSPAHGTGWVTGIADPTDGSALLCSVVLAGSRRALATSGSAQRGDHIWLGGELRPADFVQVSVAAADIVTADVLATAIVAGGRLFLDQATENWDVDAIVVQRGGELLATPGFRALIP